VDVTVDIACARIIPLLGVEPWLGVVTKCGSNGKAFSEIDEVRRELSVVSAVEIVVLSED
jgi:hypothetical protein